MPSGTFTYQFDFSGSAPTDVSANLPIINNGGSFTTLIDSYTTVGNTMYVNIDFSFTDNTGTTNDGLTFKYVYTYYNDINNNFTNLTVTAFGLIPLARDAFQFTSLSTSLIFTASDTPTILPNTSMNGIFTGSTTFNSPVNNWNTTNVINFFGAFSNATSFNQPLSNWDISNATSVSNMFSFSAFDQDLSAWGETLPTSLDYLFVDCLNFTGSNPNIGGWNTSNVIIMSNIFVNSNFNNDISSWDTNSATTMVGMFYQATSFNKDISGWNVSNVTDMSYMFNLATSFSPPGNNTNLDKILNSWALQEVQTGVILDAPDSYYSASGVDSYNTLVNTYGWTINANGPPPPPPPIICFLEGTKLLSFINGKEKYVPIQDIRSGTLVKTYLHGYVPVHSIGHSKLYNSSDKLRGKNRLYRLTKDAYSELTEDLIITGCHSVLVDRLSEKQQSDIIDELGRLMVTDRKYRLMAIYDERADTYEEEGLFNIWHLALEHEDERMNYGVYANGGLLVETTSQRMLANFSGMTLV